MLLLLVFVVVFLASNTITLGEGILQIKNVTVKDAGTYTCTVSNSNGSVQKSFRVLIQDQSGMQAIC